MQRLSVSNAPSLAKDTFQAPPRVGGMWASGGGVFVEDEGSQIFYFWPLQTDTRLVTTSCPTSAPATKLPDDQCIADFRSVPFAVLWRFTIGCQLLDLKQSLPRKC